MRAALLVALPPVSNRPSVPDRRADRDVVLEPHHHEYVVEQAATKYPERPDEHVVEQREHYVFAIVRLTLTLKARSVGAPAALYVCTSSCESVTHSYVIMPGVTPALSPVVTTAR